MNYLNLVTLGASQMSQIRMRLLVNDLELTG